MAFGPPQVPFVLSLGVTGHRADALGGAGMEGIAGRIRQTLELIAASGAALLEEQRDCFAPGPPALRFASPLADGADQIAAGVALDLGWELHVVLPFARSSSGEAFGSPEARRTFDRLIDRAACVLELPSTSGEIVDAFVMAGRATVAHCDILIAVWDGLPARGRGGTAEIVQMALTSGRAVVHIGVGPRSDTRLLWAGFDPTVITTASQSSVTRPFERSTIDEVLRRTLLPPDDTQEASFLRRFNNERESGQRPRLEYPLLLAAFGVKPLNLRNHSSRYWAAQIDDDWGRHRSHCADAHEIAAPSGLLQDAYAWADRLATHFAHAYRGGHIFNFVLGGIAVCMGVGTLLAPQLQAGEAVVEMAITLAIILNSVIGTRREWHRRWLDYRQLAERLRPMRSLQLLGIAAPDAPGTSADPVPRRWVEWYAAAIWRTLGCPAGSLDQRCANSLATAVANQEVAPQVLYHERNAEQIEILDRRLDHIGMGLFAATFLVSVATLVGYATGASFVRNYGNLFMLIQAGFPALGTALFGIRFQGDFGGDAVRSKATAMTLRQIDGELRRDIGLARAADLTEQAARVMLADLDEWRLVNQQRDLSIG